MKFASKAQMNAAYAGKLGQKIKQSADYIAQNTFGKLSLPDRVQKTGVSSVSLPSRIERQNIIKRAIRAPRLSKPKIK